MGYKNTIITNKSIYTSKYISKGLFHSRSRFLHDGAVKMLLHPDYQDPCNAVKRVDKYFTAQNKGKNDRVAINSRKPTTRRRVDT